MPNRNNQSDAPIDDESILDLNPLLKDGIYFRYMGSTTYPPCDETPVMFVRRNPLMASDRQVEVFHETIFKVNLGYGNYRSVMPLNGRMLSVMSFEQGEPPLKADSYHIDVGTNPITERELRAMKWSQRALKIAEEATMHTKELDERLRRAAEAHLEAQQGTKGGDGGDLHITYGVSTDPRDSTAMLKAIKQEGATASSAQTMDMKAQVTDQAKAAAQDAFVKAQGVAEEYGMPI